jgi:hypothetical protein
MVPGDRRTKINEAQSYVKEITEYINFKASLLLGSERGEKVGVCF